MSDYSNTSNQRTEISTLGEFGLIHQLTRDFERMPDTLRGVGDDAAVVKFNRENAVITTDFLIENIHFDLAYTPLQHLGYKSVVVNLSDLYAMNAKPKHITMSIAVSNRFSIEALKLLYSGVKLACDKYHVDLIGGDTTTSQKGLIISVTAIGEANTQDLVYRNGAKVGDLIAVTGDLGAAYMGLHILQREKEVFLANPNMQPELNQSNSYLIQRLLKPEPQRPFFNWAQSNQFKPSAMMDVSDGLSSELFHICTQSQVGALIYEHNIPIAEITAQIAEELNIDPTTTALNGGEDYELLFTFDPQYRDIVESYSAVTIIGEIKPKDYGVKMKSRGGNEYNLKAQGWVSF